MPPKAKRYAMNKKQRSRAFRFTAVFSFVLLALLQTACKDQSILIVADPVFDPPFGEVAKGTIVTITCETEDAKIWYTKDGNDPTKNPISVFLYTGPFVINKTTTIKAIAVKDGWISSKVKNAEGIYVVPDTRSEP